MNLTEVLLSLLLIGYITLKINDYMQIEYLNYSYGKKASLLRNFLAKTDDLAYYLMRYFQKNRDYAFVDQVSIYPFVYKNQICYYVNPYTKDIVEKFLREFGAVKKYNNIYCLHIQDVKIDSITYTFPDLETKQATLEINEKSKFYLGVDTDENRYKPTNIPIEINITAKILNNKVKYSYTYKTKEKLDELNREKLLYIVSLIKNYDAYKYKLELNNNYPNGLASEDDAFVPWACQITGIPNSICIRNTEGRCTNLGWHTSYVNQVKDSLKKYYNLDDNIYISAYLNNIEIYLQVNKIDLRGESISCSAPIPSDNYNYLLRGGVVVEDIKEALKDTSLEGISRIDFYYER